MGNSVKNEKLAVDWGKVDSEVLIARLEDGEEGQEEILNWILSGDNFQIICDSTSTQVLSLVMKAANSSQQEALFAKVESRVHALALDEAGHQVVKAAIATASPKQRNRLQAKLFTKTALPTLLASTYGATIVLLLAYGGEGKAWKENVVNLLVAQLSDLAVLPAALPIFRELLNSEVTSSLHPFAIELSSYPCLPTLLHHPTGHLLLEALVNKDLGAPTLHIAVWVLRHMEEVVRCPYAVSVAINILAIILDHDGDDNYSCMLTRWTDRLTSGLQPLLVEASKSVASHRLVIDLVSQQVADEERRKKSVAVVRRHQNELRESATGCVVVKSAQGWL